MTGLQILTKFQNMVGDVIDTEFAYQLLNDAKDEVEAMQIWEQLKKEQSYTVTSGYSYTSALGVLPTRFALDVRMSENTSNIDYEKIDFEDRYRKVNSTFGYFFDLNAGNIHLSGSNHTSKTMYFYYTEYSTDIAAGTSWAFPSRFHSILPIKMAELYYAADAGEKGRSWDDRWSAQFERELNRMTMWNASIKSKNRHSHSQRPYNNPKGIMI